MAAAFAWGAIIVIHFKFRRQKAKEGAPKSWFPAPFYPLGNIVCLGGILIIGGWLFFASG
ncbi:hypothetical protein FACS1894205_2500 [Alphaproteobacteria bacterium]|nr:hypothetical protein FACS1894205_2500 [Alphaproteobacteria bacterium]